MSKRFVLVAVTLVALAGARAGAAVAGTWARAAADPRIGFQLYRPTQPLGLHASVSRHRCSHSDHYVIARYAKPGSRARVGLSEGSPHVCDHRGESKPVAHVRIAGRPVPVRVSCFTRACHVRVRDGYRHGFVLHVTEPARTEVEISSTHVHLGALARLARSLKPVRRPPRHVGDFLSPDGTIWCRVDTGDAPGQASCVMREPPVGAQLFHDGVVGTCPTPGDPEPVCTSDWPTGSPRLAAGQSSARGLYRCTAAAASVTCTVTSGSAAGKGFKISAAGVTLISP